MNDNILIKYLRAIIDERYYPFYLLLISAFVLFFRLSGSIVGWDEGIYSQIAREGLLSNNWTDLHYRGQLWFEKPPLVIWLTMISYKIFGINEFAIWFFPVIFGIIGILGTYYLAKDFFNAKIGLLSSLVLISIPHYVLMSRNNMTDIFLLSNSLMSFVFLIRARNNGKYLILSGIFLGMAFLSKNFISFLFIPIFILYLYFFNRLSILKGKNLYLFAISFAVVALPWHLIMFLRHGWPFFDEYIGYNLIERYKNNILNSTQSSDALHYIKVIIKRSGSWWFVFIAVIPAVILDIKNKIYRKKLILLLFWFMFILLFFSLSVTKLHRYILILYVPFSMLIAYGLYQMYVRRSILVFLSLFIMILNVNSPIVGWVSDFGESKLIAAFILTKMLNLSTGAVCGIIIAILFYIFYHYRFRSRATAMKFALLGIFIFSMIIPFNPDRAPLAKKIGNMALELNAEMIYYFDYSKESDNLEGSLVFYSYPIPIKVIYRSDLMFYEQNSPFYCLINRSDYNRTGKLDYEFFPCKSID